MQEKWAEVPVVRIEGRNQGCSYYGTTEMQWHGMAVMTKDCVLGGLGMDKETPEDSGLDLKGRNQR